MASRHDKRRFSSIVFWDKVFEKGVAFIAFVSVFFVLLIFVFIFKEAAPFFYDSKLLEEAGLEKSFLAQQYPNYEGFQHIWQPTSKPAKYGFWPLIVGSFKVTLIAVLFASPLAILSAFYTNRFSSRWAKEMIKPAVELLSGVPSVVVGFFALIVLASLFQDVFGFTFRLNVFTGGVALGIAIIPIVFTIIEDSLQAVPRSYTEASLALGANLSQTTFKVILPAVVPAIFSALILGFGRAIGETMIVLMASGNSALLSLDFTEPVRTISATIAAEMGEVIFGSVHYTVLFSLGLFLFLFSLVLNYVATWIRESFKNKLLGEG